MDTKKLRQKILDLAIRGKLVPQDPNDEPASVLLERIRAEKERLIKEGKIKRSKKSASDDEIEAPFEIPESWEWVRLEDFVKAITDGDHQPPPQSKTGVPFLVISDVNTGVINFSHARFVSEEYYNNLPAIRRATKGDILFTVTGSYGITILVDTEQNFCFQRHIGLIKTISCSEWITIVLQSDYVHKYCDNVATGTAQKTVSLGHLRDFIIPVPPLSEQQRIVNEVERWFAVIDALESNEGDLLKAIDKAKSKILDLAIHGKLVPQDPSDEPVSVLLQKIREEKQQLVKAGKLKKKDLIETPISEDEIPFAIPDTWEWVRMQSVMEFINGRAYKKDELLEKGKYKVLRVGNLFTNDSWYFSNLELSEDKYCYDGDLLYAWSASFGPHIWEGEKTIFHYHIWNVKYNQCVLYREYLYYFFLIDKMKIKGSTTGSTMVHVSMENMKPRLIPLPPLAEQKRIVAKIEEVFAKIDKLK